MNLKNRGKNRQEEAKIQGEERELKAAPSEPPVSDEAAFKCGGVAWV